MTLGIYGSSGTGRELYGMIQTMQDNIWEQIVFIDDTKEEGLTCDCPRMPFDTFQSRYKPHNAKIVIAVGEPKIREILYSRVKKQGYSLATIIHPSSIVFHSVILGEGCVVKMHCILSDSLRLDDNVYIQSNVIIGHDAVVHKHSVISSFCAISGNCSLGERVFMGIHSCVREKTIVGSNAVIAMAAAVMKDVPENATVMGNPARIVTVNKQHTVFGERIVHER